jgi:two-component system, chemotaxis family, chemotaxis protein CheY
MGGKIRVLVADDEIHIRALIKRIVAALGADIVAEAGDGEEAVRLFEQHRPHMVVLDINMPTLTGDQALARIMAIDPKVLAIMMTAQDTIDGVRHCLEMGARNYILKSNPAPEIYRLLAESWKDYEQEIREGEDNP